MPSGLDGGYIARALEDLIGLLARHRQTATFFVVAEIYDWYPDAVRSIRSAGHEVAYHTYDHSLLTDEQTLRDDLGRSKAFLTEFQPIGFRAPFVHMHRSYYPTLRASGFRYSSSTYGRSEAHDVDGVVEIPVSAAAPFRGRRRDNAYPKSFARSLAKFEIPFGSGLFLAVAGKFTGALIARHNRANLPAVLFVHPEQLYDHEGMRGASFTVRVAMRNPLCLPYLDNVMPTFRHLLDTHKFVSFKQYRDEHGPCPVRGETES
jgi:peptidoglycan/xylan/chitin deacetylase (PgdA/CDA1 family)